MSERNIECVPCITGRPSLSGPTDRDRYTSVLLLELRGHFSGQTASTWSTSGLVILDSHSKPFVDCRVVKKVSIINYTSARLLSLWKSSSYTHFNQMPWRLESSLLGYEGVSSRHLLWQCPIWRSPPCMSIDSENSRKASSKHNFWCALSCVSILDLKLAYQII